jgi:hypothetical protein
MYANSDLKLDRSLSATGMAKLDSSLDKYAIHRFHFFLPANIPIIYVLYKKIGFPSLLNHELSPPIADYPSKAFN